MKDLNLKNLRLSLSVQSDQFVSDSFVDHMVVFAEQLFVVGSLDELYWIHLGYLLSSIQKLVNFIFRHTEYNPKNISLVCNGQKLKRLKLLF
jgi:hypothetical protein